MISNKVRNFKIIAGPSLEAIVSSISLGEQVEFTFKDEKEFNLSGNNEQILKKFINEIPVKTKMNVRVSGMFSLASVKICFDAKKMPLSWDKSKITSGPVIIAFTLSEFTLFCVYDMYQRKGYFSDVLLKK